MQMIINEQKLHLAKIAHPPRVNQIKKFNSKGYFFNIEPYDNDYLKKKHEAYQKYYDADNKENFVYNLSQKRMKIGYYEMKGCRLDEGNINKRRRVLKTITYENQPNTKIQESKVSTQKSQRITSSLFKRYMKRKEKLRAKSQRSLTSVFVEIKSNRHSIRSNSQQTSHISLKESEGSSRILMGCNNTKIQLKKILSTQLTSDSSHNEIVAVYKEKICSRRPRLKTIE